MVTRLNLGSSSVILVRLFCILLFLLCSLTIDKSHHRAQKGYTAKNDISRPWHCHYTNNKQYKNYYPDNFNCPGHNRVFSTSPAFSILILLYIIHLKKMHEINLTLIETVAKVLPVAKNERRKRWISKIVSNLPKKIVPAI